MDLIKIKLIMLCCFLLSACGPQQLPSGVVYCSEGNPESFNPQLVTSGTTIDATSKQLYNTLLNYDHITGRLVPTLATSWQISEDGTRYTFELRKNVSFHTSKLFQPSRFFNADDVLFSFNRVIDRHHPYYHVSKTGYPFFESIGFANLINRIEKVNDHKVTFHLNSPDASFLANLATDFSIILSKEYGNALLLQNNQHLLDRHPIGTGPFKLIHYVKNDFIRYYRNENYWGNLPNAQRLVFDISPSSTSRLAKLITGDCSVSALPKAGELPVVLARDELEVLSQPGFNVAFWAFNTEKAPFNDVRVRRGLAHAVDIDNILNIVYKKTAEKATGMLPPPSWAYQKNSSSITYDPKRAKELLAAANVTDLNLEIWAVPVARIYNPDSVKTAELIQADLAKVGVKAKIVSYDWSVFNQKLTQRNYDSVLLGWNADNSDPDNFFTPVLSCRSVQSNSNRSRWCNSEFDAILSHAKSITAREQRSQLYQQAQTLFLQELPIFPIAHATRMAFKHVDADDSQLTPFGGISFTNNFIDEPPLKPQHNSSGGTN